MKILSIFGTMILFFMAGISAHAETQTPGPEYQYICKFDTSSKDDDHHCWVRGEIGVHAALAASFYLVCRDGDKTTLEMTDTSAAISHYNHIVKIFAEDDDDMATLRIWAHENGSSKYKATLKVNDGATHEGWCDFTRDSNGGTGEE